MKCGVGAFFCIVSCFDLKNTEKPKITVSIIVIRSHKKSGVIKLTTPLFFLCVFLIVVIYFSFRLKRIFFSKSATVSLKIISVSNRSWTALQE